MMTPLSLQTLLLVALGGAMGAVARFLISARIQLRLGGVFPWGVLIVNVAGCTLAGMGTGWLMQPPTALPGTLGVAGFLGAFTTFSSFAADVVTLEAAGARRQALIYVGISVAAGLGGAGLGLVAGRSLSGI